MGRDNAKRLVSWWKKAPFINLAKRNCLCSIPFWYSWKR